MANLNIKLVMNLGFSHQVTVEEIEGITIEAVSYTHLTLPTICSV